MKKEVGGN